MRKININLKGYSPIINPKLLNRLANQKHTMAKMPYYPKTNEPTKLYEEELVEGRFKELSDSYANTFNENKERIHPMSVMMNAGGNGMKIMGIEKPKRVELCRLVEKILREQYNLDKDADPQHYGIGIKELWEIDPAKHKPGLVMHGAGWPLSETGSSGGWWLYHAENNQVTLGMIVDLSYENPHMYPFMEMQRWKTHPLIKQYLEGGKRISYGARAVVKGGFNSLPKLTFPGGCLIGDDAGFLNFAKIKGSHTAMKSGMLCAEAVFEALKDGREGHDEVTTYTEKFENSWLYEELHRYRNFGPAMHRMGFLMGAAFNFIDQNILPGGFPFTIHDNKPDYDCLDRKDLARKLEYPKPDGKISFDKLSSVFISGTNHEEDQPIHLQLKDPNIPMSKNLPLYDEPARLYCPAGVYEVVSLAGEQRLQINAQNCVHCKTCDIKDPSQNINWVTPEGGGGPNYPNM